MWVVIHGVRDEGGGVVLLDVGVVVVRCVLLREGGGKVVRVLALHCVTMRRVGGEEGGG